MPVIDFDRLQADCTGLFGWTPSDFKKATLHDVNLAIDGYRRGIDHQMQIASAKAAWTINGVRAAFWSRHFREIKPLDLFDPERKEPERIDGKKEREYFLSKFQKTKA